MKAASQPARARDSAASYAKEPLYRALDFVTVRAPLLPVECYRSLADEKRRMALLSDPRVLTALAVGSASLLGAIDRSNRSALTPRDADRMRAKLRRYQIRMATRPTPYGLFAGVALASWGENTDLTVRATSYRTRTRPDMAWLMNLAMSAEANPAIRRHLNFVANPLAVVDAGRVFLSERAPSRDGRSSIPVSVRATSVVKRALALTRSPIRYQDLVARLCDATPSATVEKVEKLLNELWEQTLLLTDLRPPLTSNSPARYVADRMASIPEAADAMAKLNAFVAALSTWDGLKVEERAEGFKSLLSVAGIPPDGSQQVPIQSDMAMCLEGRIGNLVAREAARTAELLLRLSPFPRGIASLAGYRQQFVNRYGHDREVPLTELLDAQRGLGPPPFHSHGSVGPDPAKAAQRAQTLIHLACAALRRRERTVQLDESAIERLETWRPSSESAPLSLDINVLIGARSAAAIDAGDFTMVLGPNLGALSAGRNLGRFADLLAPDGTEALERAAAAEQAQAPDSLWAEAVYVPVNFRLANVVIRPAVRTYELALGVTPGVPFSRVIPLDELVVGVEQGRFYVRWPAVGKRVNFSAGHMLNTHNAPAAVRFLSELSNDGKAVLSGFDWGPAESFPYLPRVQAGRIALRPAEWRIQKGEIATESPAAFTSGLQRWREEWDAPQLISLTVGDNRLILDLDREAEAAELRAEIQKLDDGRSITVQEVLPTLDEAWLQGAEGHYYSELVVSLILGPSLKRPAEANPETATTESWAENASSGGAASRLRPPGSEWLFVKLYCPRNLENDLIPESMLTFAENAVTAGLADSWFFIRYSDPDSHIRLRFHGSPQRLTGKLFAIVCDWARGLMSEGLCLKFAFETYEPEIERFGGAAGLAAAEELFGADSRACARLLHEVKRKGWPHDEITLLALSIDDLLGAIGFDPAERLRWYGGQTNARGADIGADFRQRKNLLRSVLGQPQQFLAGLSDGSAIASILAQRQEGLAQAALRLRDLAERRILRRPLDALCASFVHLHLNRMSSPGSPSEQRVISLLLRTRESLAKAPAVRTDAVALIAPPSPARGREEPPA
jgi:thiopeptide-type bacteriocin biosynthesis protein